MIDIKHISKLAGLNIKSEEESLFKLQLENVLKYISSLEEVNTENVRLDKVKSKINNRWEEDKIEQSLSLEDVLYNTNSKFNDLFKVKAILKK